MAHRQRFFIIDHPAGIRETIKFNERGGFVNMSPLHGHTAEHHWHSINDDHCIAIGYFPAQKQEILQNHSGITMLPHSGSIKSLQKHFKEKGRLDHWNSLKDDLGIDETDSMASIIELIEKKHGCLFSPNY